MYDSPTAMAILLPASPTTKEAKSPVKKNTIADTDHCTINSI